MEVAVLDVTGSRKRLGIVIGMQLRLARVGSGLEQAEVAEALGVQRQVISRVENGRALPSLDFVERYAGALGVPIRLTLGLGAMAEEKVRWGRAQAAISPYSDPEGGRDNPMLSRRVSQILDDRWLGDPTAAYLRFLDDAVGDLGPYVLITPGFRNALAFAAAHYEVIDWGAVTSALGGGARRSVHLKVARRVLEVIERADLRRRTHTG